jgi:hypothetical protein
LVGKKADSERISKFIGSLGKIGMPPDYYFVFEAAQVLGCSFMDLDEHPEKRTLMALAFTVKGGKNDGEYMRERNPEYQKMLKDASKKIEKARGRAK